VTLPSKQNVQLEQVAEESYRAIAQHFPVCSSSDEFYFFPQVVLEDVDWGVWDDFSPERIGEFSDTLLSLENRLSNLDNTLMGDQFVDAEVLLGVLRTLREQLTIVAPHKNQPTFHLTVLATGLAEALCSADPQVWLSRMEGAPAFLRRAGGCLQSVPEIFLRLGFDMLKDLRSWISGLQTGGVRTDALLPALSEFESVLRNVERVKDYHLPGEVFERLLIDHLGCGVDVAEVNALLLEELQEMEDVLMQETSHLLPGKSWTEAEQEIPFVVAAGSELQKLYLEELEQMERHCRQLGLVPESVSGAVLEVAPVPDYLTAVRASDAYAATPGVPPRGGVFYVMEAGRERSGQKGRTLEYRMTAAHEAWPGHHLLDCARWALKSSVRRSIESPLFYEGWACLAEEIMAQTGYFDGPWDRFLLAKRRAERAARGLVDVGMQSRNMSAASARELLERVGYRREHAAAVVSKYLLRPGYQVCYTLGLKQGLNLFEKYGQDDVGPFARTLLEQGEIGFSRLEKVFSSEGKGA
jgi:hypothetical protein